MLRPLFGYALQSARVCLLTLVVSHAVHAQEAPPPAEGSSEPRSTASNPARELFLEAQRLYDAADYAGALQLLRESYELAAPELRVGLLFNLAQAYRQLDRCEEARDHYADYLAGSRAKPALAQRRDDAQFYWQKLNAECPVTRRQGEAVSESPTASPASTSAAPLVVKPPASKLEEPAGPSANRIVGWSLLGAGAAAATGSLVYGLAAARAESDVEGAALNGVNYNTVIRPREDEGRLYAKYAWILGGGALFCAGMGSALLLLDTRPEPNVPALGVVAMPDGSVRVDYSASF
jgi:hypothetical protein